MKPSLHTRLINYVIGLCKKNQRWPSVLADLGYNVEFIEQQLRTSKDETLRPDIILASNRQPPHVLIVECKGGNTVDGAQTTKYNDITNTSFAHLVTVSSREQLTFDISFVDSEENHAAILKNLETFPIITFGAKQIIKSRQFRKDSLNQEFGSPISLESMVPPLHYYPFSEIDDARVVVPYVLRALVSMTVQRGRGGQDVLNEAIFLHEDMLRRIHPYWDHLSQNHRSLLIERVRRIMTHLARNNQTLRSQIGELQSKAGIRITATLQALQKTCEEEIEEAEHRTTLFDFPHE